MKKCIFGLRRYCIVRERIESNDVEFGSESWVKLYCAMCVKVTYAKAKFKSVKSYSVVNTL